MHHINNKPFLSVNLCKKPSTKPLYYKGKLIYICKVKVSREEVKAFPSVLFLNKESTGWLSIDIGNNNDGTALYNQSTGECILFQINSTMRSVEHGTYAHSYAIDYPATSQSVLTAA